MFDRINRIFYFLFTIISFTSILSAQNDSQKTKYPGMNLSSQNSQNDVIIDSEYNLLEALEGINIPYSIRKNLSIISVIYYGFDGKLHQGQLVVHKKIAGEVKEIFKLLKDIKFPVAKIIPLSDYNWSDIESMKDNNTSSFNNRYISGTRIMSMHARGLAIDINPMQNPYIKNNIVTPPGANYNPGTMGTITAASQVVKIFKQRGWTWGGEWKSIKDYQHFQKKIK
jgi:hypothetical protein